MQLTQLTMQFTWRDGLEIGVVALVFYRILRLIHGTRALQILGGVAVLVAAFAMAALLQLTMITYLLGLFFTYGVFALLIIFQPELRAALAHIGQTPVTRLFKRVEQGPVEDEIADAVDRLSRSGVGCILPLSQGAVANRSLGTRHRAALGLAEETDAIVIVVSEETAVVSVARNGALQGRLSPVQLRDLLAGRPVKSAE